MHRHYRRGESKATVASQALIKTDAVINTYLHQSRHHARKRRQEHMQAAASKRCAWS